MARRPFEVVISKKPDPLTTLGRDILTKHTADGAASPISAAAATELEDLLDEAEAQVTAQGLLDKKKEELNEDRNLLLGLHDTQTSITEGTATFYLTSIRDFLLGKFRGSERKLGTYGFTVNSPKGEPQVIIPRNADKLTKLVGKVLEKHTEDGAGSILSVFDMAALATLNTAAAQKLTAGAKANRDKETATQNRNLALGISKGQTSRTPRTVLFHVCSIRDTLLGIYRGREQSLGDWGYTVNFNSTPPPPPPPPPGD